MATQFGIGAMPNAVCALLKNDKVAKVRSLAATTLGEIGEVKLIGRLADRATLMLAGHNLKIWTKYGGADPELNFNGGTATFNRNDSWTVPTLRRYTFSVILGF